MTRTLIKIGVATVALVVAQALLAALVPMSARPVTIALPLVLISTALTVSTLLLVAAHARDAGLKLALVLFGLWGSIQANYLIETVVFDIGVPRADLPWLFAHALASALAAGAIVAGVSRLWPFPHAPTSLPPHTATPSRSHALTIPWLTLLGCGASYLALYIAAGLVIAWPLVQQHYQQWPMPNPALVFPMQIVRGAAFGLTLLLLVRQTATDRLMAGMIGGLLLSVLGGVAPLLVPNAYMPDLVRLAHLAEIVVSNFAFGLLAAWWLRPEEGQQAR